MKKSKQFYIGLVAALAIGGIFFKDPLYFKGVGLYNKLVPDPHKIEVIHRNTDSLIEEKLRLQVLLEEGDFSLYNLTIISGGGMMGSSKMTTAEADTIMERFNRYNDKEQLFSEETDYTLNVILCQWFGGNVDEARNLLEKLALETLTEDERNKVSIIKSAMALSYYDRALLDESLAGISLEKYMPIRTAIEDFLAKYYDATLDKDPINVTNEQMNSDAYIAYFADLYDALLTKDYYHNENYKGLLKDRSIEGQVTLNGVPVEGVFVYLDYERGMSSREGFYNDLVVTDEKGYYKFDQCHDNLISVCLMVPWQRFNQMQMPSRWEYPLAENGEDTLWNFEFNDGAKFSYLEIEGDELLYEIVDPLASPDRYYYLNIEFHKPARINNSSFIEYPIKYDALKGRIPLSEIHKRTDAPISYISSDTPLALERFIEPLYLTGDYAIRATIHTEARDSYIRNGIMTDKLNTIIHYKGADDYNEGDKLLDKGLYDQAMAWYADNPSEHNLRVLIELTANGTTVVEKNKFMSELTGGDPEQAIKYLKELMALTGETGRRIDYIASLYKELEDYKNEEEWLLKSIDYDASPYNYFSLAYSYLNQGRYKEGLDLLLTHGDMLIDGDRYYSYFIIGDMIDPLPHELKVVLETLEDKTSYEPFFKLIQSGENKKAYTWLMEQDESDLKMFYLLNYLESFDSKDSDFDVYKKTMALDDKLSFMDYYREVYSETQSKEIKSLYEFLKSSYNWL